ncbi:hypothetical protein SK128_002869 [Halocaridina rubra]|uniref:DNA-directed RNA polymerase II subunit GRINL1A n=1 Tax=Halocaridina rubra TaxID=373956 RepID=A0AAN8WT58_HALRR
MQDDCENKFPVYKLVNRRWKALPDKGDDVAINDPKLKQGYLGDLQSKTRIELEEIYQRNENLLQNKILLSKLKDRGKRLKAQQKELALALEEARERERGTESVLHRHDVNGFEWTGSLSGNAEDFPMRRQDRDLEDKELDPLKLLANHSSDVEPRNRRMDKMNVNDEEEDPSSAIIMELEQLELNDAKQAADAKDVPTFGIKRDQLFQEKFAHNGPVKTSFKPFRRANNPQPLPEIFIKPKPVELRPVICISQQESQKLEKEFLDKEKERELKHMIEGLDRSKKGQCITEVYSAAFGKYRDTNVTKHILDSDDEEEEYEDAYETLENGLYNDEDYDDCELG